MTKKMLIDAAHAEETRVVVTDGSRIEEFDFESQGRKQLRGNIYLAKVTRVEPSLQAAFVEYGGNRHGFLAFNEIHPDYYQIPVADREKLMRGLADDEDDHLPGPVAKGEDGEDLPPRRSSDDDDDMEEEVERRRRRLMKHYKIQEVIRRRQIMLIQVVKEERGNKGAALTTYLSLAGRYGVLMPNTDRGGGISRKITSTTDRRRLKSVVQNLDVPEGMGLIIRTAGAKRTKAEVQRDYEYLLRLWGDIREKTLHSVAPALIYEEEDLVKRAIRDMFDKDIDGVWVEGENGFRAARDFMRMLMPSQAKKVQAYRERTPLFVAHKLEGPLSQIYSPVVPLKSGGYLVINQTEALVAIDVNSGKATRERNIEATAFKTNMEAAEEACRQLRLRDLAGLIVIDFIDMEEGKNNRAVEKKLKDCLKDDRARVQMGRISSFGLMEISRQRRRTGVLEGTTHVCPHCAGVGRVRSVESSALAALRGVEIEALKGGGELILRVPAHVGFYILNEKRAHLARVHQVHDLYVTVMVDDSLGHDAHAIERTSLGEHSTHAIEAYAPNQYLDDPADAFDNDVEDEVEDEDEDLIDAEDEDAFEREDSDDDEPAARTEARSEERSETADAGEDGEDRRGRGRRRRRRGGRRDEVETVVAAPADPDAVSAPGAEEDDDSEDAQGRRRRRGRRGGRRTRDDARPQDGFTWSRPRVPFGDDPFVWHDPAALEGGAALTPPPARPAPAPRVEAEAAPVAASVIEASPEAVAEVLPVVLAAPESTDDIWVELPAEVEPAKKPRRSRAKAKVKNDEMAAAESAVTQPDPDAPVVTAPMETTADRIQPSVMRTEEDDTPVALAAEPEPVAVAAVAEPTPEVLPEPVAEVVVEAAPAAPEPALPDPAEIAAPPEKPKRGWWRR